MKKIFIYSFSIFIFIFSVGCNHFFAQKGAALTNGASRKIDSLTMKAMAGLVQGLTNKVTTQKLDSLLSNLAMQLQKSTGSLIANLTDSLIPLRDSLLGSYLMNHLDHIRETLVGKKLQGDIQNLLNTVLGDETKAKIKSLINSVVNDVLNGETKSKLVGLIDTVGNIAEKKVSALIDSALNKMKRGLNIVSDKTQQNISYLQQHAITFLAVALTMIVAAVVLIIFFIRRKEKFAQATKVIANSIEENKSSSEIQTLKSTIKSKALDADVEKFLNTFLKKKGIISTEKKPEEPPVEKK